MAGKKKPSVYTLALKQVQQANKDEQEQPRDQELLRLGEQQESMSMSQGDSKPVSQHNTETVNQQASKPVDPGQSHLIFERLKLSEDIHDSSQL